MHPAANTNFGTFLATYLPIPANVGMAAKEHAMKNTLLGIFTDPLAAQRALERDTNLPHEGDRKI